MGSAAVITQAGDRRVTHLDARRLQRLGVSSVANAYAVPVRLPAPPGESICRDLRSMQAWAQLETAYAVSFALCAALPSTSMQVGASRPSRCLCALHVSCPGAAMNMLRTAARCAGGGTEVVGVLLAVNKLATLGAVSDTAPARQGFAEVDRALIEALAELIAPALKIVVRQAVLRTVQEEHIASIVAISSVSAGKAPLLPTPTASLWRL